MAGSLCAGSRGFDVAVLQVQLNAKNPRDAKINVDGAFGQKTRAAVIRFQTAASLTADGIAGPATQAALAKGLNLSTADHHVALIAQPNESTCWAAGTAMMTRSTVPAVVARTPNDMKAPNGGLRNSSESDQAVVTGTRFGNIHGLRCHAPMSWSVSALVAALRVGPLMLDMLWRSDTYARGSGSPGHVVVISSVVSDGNPDGTGTHLLVLDPWPPNVGKISWQEYRTWINEVPTRTYRVFMR